MTLSVEIPDAPGLRLDHLLLDVNGTLTDRGVLLEGVAERLGALAGTLAPRLVSADTYGTLETVASTLGVPAQVVETGADKARLVADLGRARCVAVGNGANDAEMLGAAALGIAVIGSEGAAGASVARADVVCTSILDALDLLLEPQALVATLRR